jgi:hypothetical protein
VCRRLAGSQLGSAHQSRDLVAADALSLAHQRRVHPELA